MVKETILENGLKVLMEELPGVRSASMGIWVASGSRFEPEELCGVSHFIEHMLFKGTKTRTAREIAAAMDSIGGQINAFTTKEYTCFHSKTLDMHVGEAFEILSDMYGHSLFQPKDIKVERDIVLEEINMYEDSPEELVIDNLFECVWRGSRLKNPILGRKETLASFTHDTLVNYMAENYLPGNTVISVAGNFDSEKFLSAAAESFGKGAAAGEEKPREEVRYHPGVIQKEKDIEQNHICVGYEGIPFGDEEVYTASVLSNIFGGGMSSRLFQKIREERGLAYSIYSFGATHRDAGLFGVYAGLNPGAQREVVERVREEAEKLVKKGISKEELVRGREQIKANLIMGLESTSARMNRLGRTEIMRGQRKEADEIIGILDKIDCDAVNRMAKRILSPDRMTLSIVGAIDEKTDYEALIQK